MHTLSFEKFTNLDYYPIGNIVLYVVRENNKILYVGISNAGVYNRWFGSQGRMTKNIYDEWVTYDMIGNLIVDNMPKSFKWSIDLWTLGEVSGFLGSSSADLKCIENELICALLPSTNVIGNSKDYINKYVGSRTKEYLAYVKSHKEKTEKKSVIKARKIIKAGKIDFMTLMPEDEIPF